MKKIFYVLCLVLLVISCQKQRTVDSYTAVIAEEVSLADTESKAEPDLYVIPENSDSVASYYSGLDFSTLPVTSRMLDRWNEAQPDPPSYQYRNSSFDIYENLYDDLTISDAIGYDEKYGSSDDEKKIVGYWFALDGVDKNNEDMSFMDVLRRSRYPNLRIYPNGYFVCSWYKNTPSLIFNHVDEKSIDGLEAFRVRGKWVVRNKNLVLVYYQYRISFENVKGFYYNLTTPYELELIDLDAISDDNISTEPFAAFSQPPEILEQIPVSLIFINKPEFFIKAQYKWDVDPFDTDDHMTSGNEVFNLGKYLRKLEIEKGITLDDILTSTEGRLQEDYWQ